MGTVTFILFYFILHSNKVPHFLKPAAKIFRGSAGCNPGGFAGPGFEPGAIFQQHGALTAPYALFKSADTQNDLNT
jgi:hypothetical protein